MEMLLILALGAALLVGTALATIEGFNRLKLLYEQGGDQHWGRLADEVGLLHSHNDQGQHVLEGQRGGVWLRVHAEGAWMIIRGRIDRPMPAGLDVRRRRGRGRRRRGLRTGSPLLDSTLRVSGGPDAVPMLQDPALAAPMLEVLHAWPGSYVDERYVVLRYPDALGRELDARCQEVIDLICGLRDARSAVQTVPGWVIFFFRPMTLLHVSSLI